MLTWIRERFGKIVVYTVIVLVTFVFVFFGVFSPRSTRGLHESAVAGTVNGEPIGIPEFNRELQRRMEFFKQISGGKFTDEQMGAFRIRESVFMELARRKILIQEAARRGIEPSKEEIRSRVREVAAFQKNGQFDFQTYKDVLAANNYTPTTFERMVREDAVLAQWQARFQNRVQVGNTEIEEEFKASRTQRGLKYVLIPPEAGRKSVVVSGEAVSAFLKDPMKVNLARNQFETRKDTDFKGKKFEDTLVQAQIAREILAAENVSASQKATDELATRVAATLKADKSGDAAVAAALKPFGLAVKTTGLVSRTTRVFPGIGESKELFADAFSDASPIDQAKGGKARVYRLPQGTVVAVLNEAKNADLAQLATEREAIASQIQGRKTRALFEEWVKTLTAKAKIDQNPSVVSAGGAAPDVGGES